MSPSACWVAAPSGICHGLNSAYSPRIVTKVRNGNSARCSSENMFTQFPTPLLCISSTARCTAEPRAADHADAFLLGGQDDVVDVRVTLGPSDNVRVPGVGT